MTTRTPNNVKRKTEFAAQDDSSLSCAEETVGVASSKKYSWRLNVDNDDANVRPNGRLFQILAAAT